MKARAEVDTSEGSEVQSSADVDVGVQRPVEFAIGTAWGVGSLGAASPFLRCNCKGTWYRGGLLQSNRQKSELARVFDRPKTLADYNSVRESTVQLMLRLRGGVRDNDEASAPDAAGGGTAGSKKKRHKRSKQDQQEDQNNKRMQKAEKLAASCGMAVVNNEKPKDHQQEPASKEPDSCEMEEEEVGTELNGGEIGWGDEGCHHDGCDGSGMESDSREELWRQLAPLHPVACQSPDEDMQQEAPEEVQAESGDEVHCDSHLPLEVREALQYSALMSSWNETGGFPPMLSCHKEVPLKSATFALPAFLPSKPGVPGRARAVRASVDLQKFSMPCVALVREADDTARPVWSCDCCAKNICIQRTVEALHMVAGGCSDVVSADCACVRYCQDMMLITESDVEEIIMFSPVHEPEDVTGV